MPVTTGMKGSGFYDQHSSPQLETMRLVYNWIDEAIADMSLPQDARPFTVLDLGSSEGRNALVAMSWVIEMVRRRRAAQVIQTIYSDLPSNNFKRLFLNLDEARKSGRVPERVYASAVAGSFYEPLMPPRSIHFAMTFNAVQWIDKLPAVAVPDFVSYRRPIPSRLEEHVSPETTQAYSRQADDDLVRFLQSRADELTPGGKLLIVAPGDSAENRVVDGLYDALNDACLDLVAAGRLPRQRYERFTMPLYFRTVAEMLAPLERQESPLMDAFTIDRAESLEVPTAVLRRVRSKRRRGETGGRLPRVLTRVLRAGRSRGPCGR